MSALRIGSLCTGYGGLDMAVQAVLGGELAWVADPDPGAAAILAHHHPNVPNLGDITKVDWATVDPVDVICVGFPCTDVSLAGKREGLHEHTRSGVWTHVAQAIETLRPQLVYIENVRGLLSAEASSDLEPCPWCLGDTGDQPALRALGAVLGDLADLGFDAEWHGLRASDVEAPHQRFRVLVLAWSAADTSRDGRDERRPEPAGIVGGSDAAVSGAAVPSDATNDRFERGGLHGSGGPDLRTVIAAVAADSDEQLGQQRRIAASGQAPSGGAFGSAARRDRASVADALLPTPAARDIKGPAARKNGIPQLPNVLLPTPTATPYGNNQSPSLGAAVRPSLDSIARDPEPIEWGKYEIAVRRWEAMFGPAPEPTQPAPKGGRRLNPAFSEWMMGIPGGHVTAVPDLSRNQMLTAIGNGVFPQQGAAALALLLDRMEAAA